MTTGPRGDDVATWRGPKSGPPALIRWANRFGRSLGRFVNLDEAYLVDRALRSHPDFPAERLEFRDGLRAQAQALADGVPVRSRGPGPGHRLTCPRLPPGQHRNRYDNRGQVKAEPEPRAPCGAGVRYSVGSQLHVGRQPRLERCDGFCCEE
jgi:hypothetical protein